MIKSASFGPATTHGDQEIYRILMESLVEAVFVIEPHDFNLLDVNQQAATLLGYSIDELLALGMEGLLPDRGDRLRAAAAGTSPVTIEQKLRARDGRNLHCTLTVRPLKDSAHPRTLLIAGQSGAATPAVAREDLIETALAFPSIIGQSPEIRQVCRLIGLVAQSDATVLIQGESGTGKELVAQAIHFHSRRAQRPLIKVNCAALTETLLESELFGHRKGAFTGAVQDRKGRFKLADGGTIILDEIDSLSLSGQAKLLRVLQEREFEPVGDATTIKIDVRVVAVTNADLTKAISAGRFREDLYYRLNAFPIRLPPLRERREDLALLVGHFLQKYSTALRKQVVAPDLEALAMLMDYPWPGNVRELENTIEYAVILEKGRNLSAASLPDKLKREEQPKLSLKDRLEAAEKQILLEALSITNGVKQRAAALLGIDRRNFGYFLNKHGIR
ncbi:MAG TPA: sigma 54-interacting transcriptional regulator [Blastocatellia bacterium]|nr:sigma 54-interacting transcriptional regulator [Blastocatellia bacterium]